MNGLRSLLFLLLQTLLTLPYGVLGLVTFALPRLTRYRLIRTWSTLVTALAVRVLGIRYTVEGLENLPVNPDGSPAAPVVILSKHQSAWETIAFQQIFPPLSFVLKRELLRLPFFGWGLAAFSPVAINRSAGREALKQLVEQGQARLAAGFWVIVFPEGTRMAPGERGHYQIGGAWLAGKAGVPVLPVAHNAGECWKKNALVKQSGRITVRIGPPIATAGRKPAEVNAEVEAWIETQMLTLPSPR
jgi:1-acyl-sn-glycerol-3-phosphate acyltransferase